MIRFKTRSILPFFLICSAAVIAGEPEGGGEKKPDQKPDAKKTYTVKTEKFSIITDFTGILESLNTKPVAVDLKRWSDMRIVSAVPHGAEVKKGDVLIEFETEKLEKKIRDLKLALPEKAADLRTSELELAKLEETTPILKEKAVTAKADAESDLTYFEEVSRPMREKDAKEDTKSMKNSLAYAEEELAQLKKMYERDDLTEETEEIVLQRAQNTVNTYKWMLEQTEERGERSLKTTIPREHERLVTAVELRDIEWKTDERNFEETLEKKRLELEKKRREFEEAKLSLSEHESDLAAMKVKSPMNGVVYYGIAQRGKWTTAATLDRKLIPGQAATMREVMMTIVDPADLQLRVAVKEDQLRDLTPGKKGTATLKWNPDAEMKVKVESVAYVPFADNTFDAALSLTEFDEEIPLMPGMQAVAKVETYLKKRALTVPLEAVKKDDDVETVTLEDGKKREVKTGRKDKKKVEIVKGLEAGDVILLGDSKTAATKPTEGKPGKAGESDKPAKK